MDNIYKYPNLSEIESQPEFVRLRQMGWEHTKSIQVMELETKEKVCKVILNKIGYPNNVELCTYQNANKTEFVDVKTNKLLACVEVKNDGIMFYVETNYYGDWYK